jgi:tRNA C32,U32 (ribose-2'-O)-methylase TrmJ
VSELVPPCVILNAPQLAENIGAVARVMGNFGLYSGQVNYLWLVARKAANLGLFEQPPHQGCRFQQP